MLEVVATTPSSPLGACKPVTLDIIPHPDPCHVERRRTMPEAIVLPSRSTPASTAALRVFTRTEDSRPTLFYTLTTPRLPRHTPTKARRTTRVNDHGLDCGVGINIVEPFPRRGIARNSREPRVPSGD